MDGAGNVSIAAPEARTSATVAPSATAVEAHPLVGLTAPFNGVNDFTFI